MQKGTSVIVSKLFSTLPVRFKEFERNIKKVPTIISTVVTPSLASGVFKADNAPASILPCVYGRQDDMLDTERQRVCL